MPPLEVGHELEAEQQEHDDQKSLDDAVEARRGRIGGGIGRRDSAIRCAEEDEEGAGHGGEGGGDLLKLEEVDPGQLAGAS